MKKIASILALCLLLALTACGKMSNEELMATVPTLTANSGSQQVMASANGGSWTCKGQSFVADGLHPLQALDTLSTESNLSASAGAAVNLSFSVLPDSVTVTYWSADAPVGDTIPEGQTVETSFNNNLFSFTLPEQNVVVQIEAQWTSYSDMSGSFGYGFMVQ